MKSKCYRVERFNNPPPILGTGFPLSPYAFILHFREPVTFSDDEARKRASATVAKLLQLDKGNPHAVECPNENVQEIIFDLDRLLGEPLGPREGSSDEWAIVVPPGSNIPVTKIKPEASTV